MYSTKTATTNNAEFTSAYMPVGINEHVQLKDVEIVKSPQGKDFIRFTFTNKEGQTVNFTEWKNEKNMWIKTDADLQQRDDQQFGRILQLVNCYFDTTPDFEGNSFLEMINWVKSQLETGMKNNNKDLRLKVIYDKNGYTTVSKYGVYVEPNDTAESNIKLFKNDLMERPVVADNESANPLVAAAEEAVALNTPVTDSTFNTEDPNELPF